MTFCGFATKAQAMRAYKALLNDSDLNHPLSQPLHSAMLELLEFHHNKAGKVGCGIRHFEVREHYWQGRFRCRGFWIVRTDGSEIDFSYLACFASPERRARDMLAEACREAVADDVLAFRQAAFAGRPQARCAVTGQLIAASDAHVDHAEPWPFRRILAEWLASSPAERALTSAGGLAMRFADPAAAADFRRFHNERAQLRVVHRTVNLAWRKSDAA